MLLVLATALALGNVAAFSQAQSVSWYSVGTGFAEHLSGNARLLSSVGQSITGYSVGNAYAMSSGFLAGILKVTDVEGNESAENPEIFELTQNFPNPFNPSTTIRYTLPQRSHVSLSVFNTLGQLVETLQNAEQEAGSHDITFDATSLPTGVYFYRIQAGSFIETRKLILLK